jgi:hypothetical protein
MFKDSDVARLEKLTRGWGEVADKLIADAPRQVTAAHQIFEAARELAAAMRAAAGRPAPNLTRLVQSAPAKGVVISRAVRGAYLPPIESVKPSANGDLPQGEKAILSAAAQHPGGVTREQLTILIGYKRSSRDTYLQRLRTRGFVDDRGKLITATSDGVAALGTDYQPLPVGAELRQYWLERLPRGEREIFSLAVEHYPRAVQKSELDTLTNYKRSSRDTYIQRLRARLLVVDQDGAIKASDLLF